MPKKAKVLKTRPAIIKSILENEVAAHTLLPWDHSRRQIPQLGAVGAALKEATNG